MLTNFFLLTVDRREDREEVDQEREEGKFTSSYVFEKKLIQQHNFFFFFKTTEMTAVIEDEGNVQDHRKGDTNGIVQEIAIHQEEKKVQLNQVEDVIDMRRR